MSAAPPIVAISTLPLLSCTVRSPFTLRASTLPNEVVMFPDAESDSVTAPLPPVIVAAPWIFLVVMLPKRLRTSSVPFTSNTCTEPFVSVTDTFPPAPVSSMPPKELFTRADPTSRMVMLPWLLSISTAP